MRFCADRMQSSGGGLKFPKLNVDTSDVAGVWREFLDSFRLAAEFATESWGTRVVDGDPVNRFTDRMKLIAFRDSIGSQGEKS